MPDSEKIIIEVMYKASYCLPCRYMDGKLVFDTTPGSDELKEYLNKLISA